MGDIISGYLNSLPDKKKEQEDVLDKSFNELMERIKANTENVNSPAHYGGKGNVYEAINHPEHYGGENNPYEAIKVIEAYDFDFITGNIVKYLFRHKKKNGFEDLQKAQWYMTRLVERERIKNGKQNE